MKLKVTIKPDGSVTTKVEGGQGASCKNASAWLEKAIGQTTADAKLPEYFETATDGATVKGNR